MTGLSPAKMPRLRADMIAATRRGAAIAATENEGMDLAGEIRLLQAAELYWVTREMTQVAVNASANLPDWTPAIAMPHRFGLLLWEGDTEVVLPWNTAPDRGHVTNALGMKVPPQVPVRGVTWGPTPEGMTAWALGHIADMGDLLTDTWRSAPLFPFAGVRLGTDKVTREDMRGTGVDLVAVLGATWLLMMQPGIATTTPLHVDRSEGGGKRPPRPDRTVSIISLRRERQLDRSPDEPGPGDGRVYRHRWLVRSHWRQQAVGPGRSQHRPVFIMDHIKGPEGAPMLDIDHVNVWRR